MKDLSGLESSIGYIFTNRMLLKQALTHSTYSYENRNKESALPNNERLEYLGDALLDFVIAEYLYTQEPNQTEGYLSKTRALIVCEYTLVETALDIKLGKYLYLGRGEELTSGREKPSNLANGMEALFAAVFLDGGLEKAKEVILFLLSSYAKKATSGELIFDYKSKVLEFAQMKGNSRRVCFKLLDESGPIHDKTYECALYLDGEIIAKGKGGSKKLSEQAAAKKAYTHWKKYFL